MMHARETLRLRDGGRLHLYERRQYAGFASDSDVFGFKSRVTYKFKTVLRKEKTDYLTVIKILKLKNYDSREGI